MERADLDCKIWQLCWAAVVLMFSQNWLWLSGAEGFDALLAWGVGRWLLCDGGPTLVGFLQSLHW